MTHMKHILTVLALLVAFVSCNEHPVVVRDTIPYVKQLAADTTGIFRLVHTYRTAGTKGSIAVIGEPEAAARLASAFLSADRVDNIDGRSAPDRLPDFAGETFDILMDLYNAPYIRFAASSPDSLREVAVRNAVTAVDTVAYSNAAVLSFYSINLTKIQSLPVIGHEWEYMFYVDVTYQNLTRYRQSIDAIIPLTKELKILGEYKECTKYSINS